MKRKRIVFWGIAILATLLMAGGLASTNPPAVRTDGEPSVTQAEQSPAAPAVQSQQPTRAGEQIKWQVVATGGAKGTSTIYVLSGTAGQTAAGPGSSTSYKINQGFQQSFSATYLCGDVDANGFVNISDAVYVINYIFGGGPAPNPVEAGDVDCNGFVNISDAVYLINYIFGGGPEPCAGCK